MLGKSGCILCFSDLILILNSFVVSISLNNTHSPSLLSSLLLIPVMVGGIRIP